MVDELIKILEQDSAEFRSFQDYSCAVTELFGVEQLPDGEVRFISPTVDSNTVDLADLAQAFLGRNWKEILREYWAQGSCVYQTNIFDSATPRPSSHPANVARLVAFAKGMLDATFWQHYNAPYLVRICALRQVRKNLSGVDRLYINKLSSDVKVGPLALSEALPVINLDEVWVDIPNLKLYGGRIALDLSVFIDNKIEYVLSAAAHLGKKTAWDIEGDIARTVLGIDNTYRFISIDHAFYQKTADVFPFNYINELKNPLQDPAAVYKALQTLESNDDLSHVPVILRDATIYVMRQQAHQAANITHIMSTLGMRIGYRVLNYAWYDAAIKAGISPQRASNLWLCGDLARAFAWVSIHPVKPMMFVSNDATLQYHAEERGTIVQFEPRYICKNHG